jgi:eukaryotic-like serine/threonine-protein kinase
VNPRAGVGLGGKIFGATVLVVVATLGGALFVTQRRANRAADASITRALSATRTAMQSALDSKAHSLLAVTAGLVQVPSYVQRVSQGITDENPADLLDQAAEFREQTEASWAMITDQQGIVRAWTLDPELIGEDFSGGALIDLARSGDTTTGLWIEPGPKGDVLYQAVGVPMFDPTRTRLEAALITALPIDSALVDELVDLTNSEIAFFSIDSADVAHVVFASIDSPEFRAAIRTVNADSLFEAEGAGLVRLEADGETWVGVAGPLLSADSAVALGGYIGLRSRDQEMAPYLALRQTILFAFFGGLALALLASLVLTRGITRPVKQLVQATRGVREGRYDIRLDVKSRDEIGLLAAAFQRMVTELKEQQDLVVYLRQVAETAQLGATPRGVDTDAPTTLLPALGQTSALEAGQIFAKRYEVKEILGAGGMGVVYRALDRQLEEIVAIKTLKREGLTEDPVALDRFKQEIRLARRITHKNVVRTHDIGEENGTYYITMEYVDGTTLKDLILKRGRLPVRVVLTLGKQLCRALEVAHEAGVIHRDIKPQNLVVDGNGFLKVMDFGIARLTQASKPGQALTQVGTAIGTPEYMSPEQLMGEELDARVDIYAAGIVLFECVTGRTPFDAPTIHALMMKQIEEPPPDPRTLNSSVPEALASLILKALAKRRQDRWPTVADLHRALDDVAIPA